MSELSEELKNEQYYYSVLDTLIDDHDIELKNRLQLADGYTQFIQEQSKALMESTINIIRKDEISFLEASEKALEEWKFKNFQ